MITKLLKEKIDSANFLKLNCTNISNLAELPKINYYLTRNSIDSSALIFSCKFDVHILNK